METQRSFHAKTKCDSRVYEYLLPSYALKCLEKDKEWTSTPQTDRDIQIATSDGAVLKYVKPTDPQLLSSYRISQARFNKFEEAMSHFVGTHNFHNYTIARNFHDRSSNRYIIDIKVCSYCWVQAVTYIALFVLTGGKAHDLQRYRMDQC